MKKRRLLLSVLIISLLPVSIVWAQNYKAEYKTNIKGNKKVTVIKDIKNILVDEISAKKVNNYEGVVGYDWVDENKIIVTKENNKVKAVENELGVTDVQNLYLYDLNTKKEKSISDKSKCIRYAVFSPDKKHIFYVTDFGSYTTAYISDAEGNIKVTIKETNMGIADFAEARWSNNKELVMPYLDVKGFYVVDVDGISTKIKNVEMGITGNQDLFNGLNIVNTVKVGHKIYYKIIHHDARDDNKMKVYDIRKRETKEFIKDEVDKFYISPNNKQFVIIKPTSDKSSCEFMLTDLQGEDKEVLKEALTQGYPYGESWSPDGTKISYISTEGVCIIDLKNKKKSLVASGEYYIPTKWSPSSKKIMVHATKEKDGKFIDRTNIITLSELKK